MAHALRRGGMLSATLLASLLAGLVVAGGGCEIGIGDGVGAFECIQGPAVCPGTEVCDPVSHQCVASCTESNCSAGLECDPGSGLCIASEAGPGDDAAPDSMMVVDSSMADTTMPPADTGSPTETGSCRVATCPCSGAASCDSAICADQITVGMGLYVAAGSQSFCTATCCTSADCPAGTVCFATDIGGNYCVAPGWLSRSASLGAGLGGASCQSGRDCRSGLCNGQYCADVCCSTNGSNTECSGGTTCRFETFPGAATFDKNSVAWCGDAGTGQNGETCTHDSDCESELCNGGAGCSNACRNTPDCGGQGMSCAYVTPTMGGTGVVAACLPGGGHSGEGSSCSSDTDCESQFCDPTSNECTDVCFTDADCTKTDWVCRPEIVQLSTGGSFTVLACGS
jgi:hypothetical protein